MAATPSTMLPLGTVAPGFSLPDTVTNRTMTLDELRSPVATVVMFICNHCPFVVHVVDGLAALADEYAARGVSFIAISSNDATAYPDDSPEHMGEFARRHGFAFPYLYDESQDVARAYQAACTPDFYVFDGSMALVYRGQMDSSRPGNGIPVSGDDLRAALDAIIAGRSVSADQRPSIGCNIKWRKA